MKRKYKGKCTTLITYKDGNYKLDSEYYKHKINCQNKELQNLLNSSLAYMALTDIDYENTCRPLISILFKTLYTAKNQNDLNDIETFINQVLGYNEEIDYLLNDLLDIVKNNGQDILILKDETKQDLIDSINRKTK